MKIKETSVEFYQTTKLLERMAEAVETREALETDCLFGIYLICVRSLDFIIRCLNDFDFFTRLLAKIK